MADFMPDLENIGNLYSNFWPTYRHYEYSSKLELPSWNFQVGTSNTKNDQYVRSFHLNTIFASFDVIFLTLFFDVLEISIRSVSGKFFDNGIEIYGVDFILDMLLLF